jgi:GTPase involved in cell partitioning and DNA repair
MKTGIALLPEVERTQAITFSVIDFLISNKFVTIKQASNMVSELEEVVLSSSLNHDVFWDQIHYQVNNKTAQEERSNNSQIKRINQKNQMILAVEQICDSNPNCSLPSTVSLHAKAMINSCFPSWSSSNAQRR